ncbi:hypothetical protein KY284_005297 [Solanum tuberosum]|nr:hypothetical protein KY284_005297 [Solanum tuberosum]
MSCTLLVTHWGGRGRGHFGYTCSAIIKKGELKGQKVVVKVIPKAKKELIALWLLERNKSLVTAESSKYGKKVPKIVNVKLSPRHIQQPRLRELLLGVI